VTHSKKKSDTRNTEVMFNQIKIKVPQFTPFCSYMKQKFFFSSSIIKKLTKNFPVFSILPSGNSGCLICKETTNSTKYTSSATFSTYNNFTQKINIHFPFTFKLTLTAYMAQCCIVMSAPTVLLFYPNHFYWCVLPYVYYYLCNSRPHVTGHGNRLMSPCSTHYSHPKHMLPHNHDGLIILLKFLNILIVFNISNINKEKN